MEFEAPVGVGLKEDQGRGAAAPTRRLGEPSRKAKEQDQMII